MPLLDTRARRLKDWSLSVPALGIQRLVPIPSAWEDHGVPRTFEGPCDYRYTLRAQPEPGKRYWLRCEGASYEAKGFLNEQPIGVHRGIWDGFSWDLTSALHEGDNALHLQVIKNGGSTFPVPQVLSGFLPYVSCTFGGLWQPVYLFETGAAWLTDLYVRGEADGSVMVQGTLEGALPAAVRLTVYAPTGEPVYHAIVEAAQHWQHDFRIHPHHSPPLLPPDHAMDEGRRSSPSSTTWERGSGSEGILTWHPTHPHLYRLVAEVYHAGALSHRVETEFGLRTVSVDGSVILLNGEPFYPRGVLHWGWYLHAHAPCPPLPLAEQEIRSVQLCGFNLLKACLWVPGREYLSLCDRLGMAVWLELPLWLPAMDTESIAQVKREYEAIIRQVRNHPSVLLWTLGCELSARFPAEVLGELYTLVKQLTGSPLVRDNSGGGECYGGALQEYADFADYHLYGDAHFARTTFRAFLDTHRPPAPWLQGEFADHDTQRDFITLRQNAPPEQLWWLQRDPEVNPRGVRWFYETPFVEERLQQEGVWDALPELVRTSRREMHAYHKLVLETMRTLRGTSGYVVTGLKDTPITTAGILDERSELKVSPEIYADFNADTVLLLDWHRRREWVAGGDRPANPDPYNHFGGRTVYPRIAVSHFGKPLAVAELRWRIASPQPQPFSHAVGEGSSSSLFPTPWQRETADEVNRRVHSGITFLKQLEVHLPAVEVPHWVQFEVELVSPEGAVIAANRWRWGIYPAPDWASLGAIAVYDPAETLWGLPAGLQRLEGEDYERFLASPYKPTSSPANARPSGRSEEPRYAGAVLLTTRLEPEQIAFIRQGGAALWLVGEPTSLLPCERVPFWREAAHRFLPHPLWEWIPRPEFLDERLFAFSTDLAGRAKAFLESPIQPLWQRVDTRTGYTHWYLGEVRIGAGTLLLTTLHFAGAHGDTPLTLRYHPAGQYWLWAMVRYLASR